MVPGDRRRFPPARLEYESRLWWPAPAVRPPPRPVDVAGLTVRVAGATTSAVTAGCLLVAVPCVVFAVVGAWFGDSSAASAAGVAVATGAAAAVAAVPALVCHRLGHRPPCRRSLGSVGWN